MFEDKTLVCKDCGAEFVFTAGEQEFYREKGFSSEPQRCIGCRKRRKNNTNGQGSVVLYEIVCSKCGEIEKIPFEPKHDRPLFCSVCYRNYQEGRAVNK